jgi:Arc/MetJ-type ribon-helix-helix transcriptional regulator
MSDKGTLARTRTVRFSLKIDRQLEAKAARHSKTVSEVIRESVVQDLDDAQTAADWVLRVARKARPNRKPDDFSRAYGQRHRQ